MRNPLGVKGLTTQRMASNVFLCYYYLFKSIFFWQDRHADGHMMPEIDSQQDYELISLTEENGKTIMKFKRKFDTWDADDNKIEVCHLTYF